MCLFVQRAEEDGKELRDRWKLLAKQDDSADLYTWTLCKKNCMSCSICEQRRQGR